MRPGLIIAATALLSLASGCMTQHRLETQLQAIKDKHNVTVRADNPLSRFYLFGNLPGLLRRIDADLDECPQYFKDNLGPVLIEESFADNPETYPLPFMLRGYVDPRDAEGGFPVYLKNRSLVERILFYGPGEGDLFLHEATHSFEASVRAANREYWDAFKRSFDDAQPRGYGGTGAVLAMAIFPPVHLARPRGMPSFYGWTDHWEDVAETHCLLARRDGGEYLKGRDEALYAKCRILGSLVKGEEIGGRRPVRRGERIASTLDPPGDESLPRKRGY